MPAALSAQIVGRGDGKGDMGQFVWQLGQNRGEKRCVSTPPWHGSCSIT